MNFVDNQVNGGQLSNPQSELRQKQVVVDGSRQTHSRSMSAKPSSLQVNNI